MKEVSDILSQAIEMVEVVFNNDQISFGNRLHVCMYHNNYCYSLQYHQIIYSKLQVIRIYDLYDVNKNRLSWSCN